MSDVNEQNNKAAEKNKSDDSAQGSEKVSITPSNSGSGDPGRTPGSAEGVEETIDEDIRQKEAEGKL